MSEIISRIKYVLCNLVTIIFLVFIRKKENIILIGGWMAKKYSDNSRFLYQELSLNMEKYNLKKVIWVTDDLCTYNMLRKNGFFVVKYHSFKSIYWHMKSGIHIICNSFSENKWGLADINTKFSIGAFKLQLWHGAGQLKRIPKYEGTNGVNECRLHRLIRIISSPGGWTANNYFILDNSELDDYVYKYGFGMDSEHIIHALYPRLLENRFYTENEKKVIKKIREHKYIIGYFPTFRKENTHYTKPLQDKRIYDYIKSNNILWIEKSHDADTDKDVSNQNFNDNILCLNHSFDINSIIRMLSLVITDYSSVTFDAYYWYVNTIHYVPDINYYENEDRGFFTNFDDICVMKKVTNINELLPRIKEGLEENNREVIDIKRNNLYQFYDRDFQYLWNKIIKCMEDMTWI